MLQEWFNQLEAKDYIATVSATIAVCAFGISIWNAAATRRHNKLSVRPHLTFNRFVVQHPPQITITLKNNGLGPAIIERVKIYLDKIQFPLSEVSDWYKLIKEMNIADGAVHGYVFDRFESIRAGESINLLQVYIEGDCDCLAIRSEIDRITIVTEYKSIYEENFVETCQKK